MDELHGCEWTSLRRRATQQLHSTFKLARLTATAAETFGTSVRSTNRSYSHVSAHKANGRVKPAATTQLEHMRLSVRTPPVVENTHTHTQQHFRYSAALVGICSAVPRCMPGWRRTAVFSSWRTDVSVCAAPGEDGGGCGCSTASVFLSLL